MANDFAVRKHPLFHLVRAQVHLSNGETEAAVKALEEAMKIPGIRPTGQSCDRTLRVEDSACRPADTVLSSVGTRVIVSFSLASLLPREADERRA